MVPGNVDAGISTTRRSYLRCSGVGTVAGLAGCIDTIGFRDDDQPLAGETIRIGLLNHPTGPDAGYGRRAGMELAVSEIEANGGIGGANIKLLIRDTSESPRYRTHYDVFHNEHDVDVTFGQPPDVNHENPLWPIPHQKTLHMTLGAWGKTIVKPLREEYEAYKYHFRIGMPNGIELAEALTEFVTEYADDVGWETAALYFGWPLPNDVTKSFADTLWKKLPENIGRHSKVSFSAPHHFIDYFEDLAADGVDVLFVSDLFDSRYVRLWEEIDRPFDLGGLHMRSTHADFWEATDGACEGMFSLSSRGPKTEHTEHTLNFVKDYVDEHGARPPNDAATAYDAMYVYKQAVETAIERSNGSEKPSQESIVQVLIDESFAGTALYPTYEFRGPNDRFPHEPKWWSMSEDGIPVVKQWLADGETGNRAVVAPKQHRNSTFRSSDN